MESLLFISKFSYLLVKPLRPCPTLVTQEVTQDYSLVPEMTQVCTKHIPSTAASSNLFAVELNPLLSP